MHLARFFSLSSFLATLHICECSLIFSLQEPPRLLMSLSIDRNQPRPINLVQGHTYHIMCRDTNKMVEFDQGTNVWRVNGSSVRSLSSSEFPGSSVSAVYASTDVSDLPNEWTLVLQRFGVNDVGVYSCHGRGGEIASLRIGETALSVLAPIPRHDLIAGLHPTNNGVSLSPFISPPSSTSSVTWFFNNDSSLPPGVRVLVSQSGSEIFLRSPIMAAMRGNYTCRVQYNSLSASATFQVNVNVPPNLVLSPSGVGEAINGSRLNLSCTDRMGFPSADIFWNRNGINLTQDGRIMITNTRRGGEVESTLLIDPIMPSDVGLYHCTAQNIAGPSQRNFNLTQVLVFSSHLERSTLLEGETLSLQVRISNATPILQVQWLKDGLNIANSSSRVSTSETLTDRNGLLLELQVRDTHESDSGSYACEVSTALTTGRIEFDPITVLGVEISSIGYPTNYSFFVGLMLDLTCIVTLTSHGSPQNIFPNLEMRWRKNGRNLPDHVSISDTVRMNSLLLTYTSNISFAPLTRGDEGDYVCSVTRGGLPSDHGWMLSHTRTVILDSVLFQLRILMVGQCQDWVNFNGKEKVDTVISFLVSNINRLCPSCALTTNHITSASFLCFPNSPHAVTFRARLHGTERSSSSNLLRFISEWIRVDGTISIQVVLHSVDKRCPVTIATLRDNECAAGVDLSTRSPPTSGVPLNIVIGASAGVAFLLIVIATVTITIILVMVSKNRRMKAAMEEASAKSTCNREGKSPVISAINPSLSLTGHSNQEVMGGDLSEPHYEDIDKYHYDTPRGKAGGPTTDEYEKMRSIQIHSIPNNQYLEYDYAAIN